MKKKKIEFFFFDFFFVSKRFFGTFPSEIRYFDPNRICSPESHLSDAKKKFQKFQPEKKLEAKAQNLFGEFWGQGWILRKLGVFFALNFISTIFGSHLA